MAVSAAAPAAPRSSVRRVTGPVCAPVMAAGISLTSAPVTNSQPPPTSGRIFLGLTRVVLPVVIAIAGVVLIVLGHASLAQSAHGDALKSGTGVGLVIVAAIVWLINLLFRMSLSSNRDREAEEDARRHFDRTGIWPDEEKGDG